MVEETERFWEAVRLKEKAGELGDRTLASAARRKFAALSAAGAADQSTVAKALLQEADCLLDLDDYAGAGRVYERVLKQFRETDRKAVSLAAQGLGELAALRERDYGKAREYFDLGGRVAATKEGREQARLWKSYTYMLADDRAAAAASLSGVLETSDGYGVRSSALEFLGALYLGAGELEDATKVFEEYIELERAMGNPAGEAEALRALGLTKYCGDDLEGAHRLLELSLTIDREIGSRVGVATDLCNMSLIKWSSGEVENALDSTKEAYSLFAECGNRTGEATALSLLGDYHSAGHSWVREFELFKNATRTKDVEPSVRTPAHRVMATMHRHGTTTLARDLETASAYYEQAGDLYRELGEPVAEGTNLGNLGMIQLKLGEREEGVRVFREVRAAARKGARAPGFDEALAEIVSALYFGKIAGQRGGDPSSGFGV